MTKLGQHDHDLATTRRLALRWLVTFVGFPLGGLAAEAIAGPVDALTAALVGGAISGAVLGAVQWWGLGRAAPPPELWVLATGLGFAAGLALGAGAVDYGTGMADLALQGAICGGCIGAAQALVLGARLGPVSLAWIPMLAASWALGWTITTAIGVDVESQYTVFGSSGALVVTVLTVVLPLTLARRSRTESRTP